MERGRLRRIFGKVAAVAAVIATVAFYALGLQIGTAYYQDWQASKAETTISMVEQQAKTENLPWAAAGTAIAVSYGAGFAAIAAGKKRDSYGGYSSSGYSSSSNDGFFWGYMMGSGNGGGGSRSSSSSDSKGAAAALVIVGAAAIAAGATVVSYKAVKANFFTGEAPLKKQGYKELSPRETFTEASTPQPEVKSEPQPEPVPVLVALPEPVKDIVVDPALVKRWKPFAI